MSASTSNEYVLGTGSDEWDRLQIQHRLWSDAAVDAWKRAGFGGEGGRRIIDVGCGPGHATMDLAQLVGRAGEVVGVDESPGFIESLHQQAAARGFTWARGVRLDVQRMGGAEGDPLGTGFDGAYARWVLCFVPDPDAVIAGVAARLRPGGRLVIHDYFNYESMTTAPRTAWHDALVRATADSWREPGGDPDIVGRLPAIIAKHGLRLDDLRVHQRIARGGVDAHGRSDPMMQWPVTWWRTFAPKLVGMGRLRQDECDASLRALDELSRDPSRFIACPPVFEVIASKR